MTTPKTCIVCEQKTSHYDTITEQLPHEMLCVCEKCEKWYTTNMALISTHRDLMMSKFSPAVLNVFQQKPALEQGYIVIRSLEKQCGK